VSVCVPVERKRDCVHPTQAKIIKGNHLLSYWWVEKAKGTKSLVLFPQPTFSVSGSFQRRVLSPFFTSFCDATNKPENLSPPPHFSTPKEGVQRSK